MDRKLKGVLTRLDSENENEALAALRIWKSKAGLSFQEIAEVLGGKTIIKQTEETLAYRTMYQDIVYRQILELFQDYLEPPNEEYVLIPADMLYRAFVNTYPRTQIGKRYFGIQLQEIYEVTTEKIERNRYHAYVLNSNDNLLDLLVEKGVYD